MAKNPNEFTAKTRTALAKRASYICSNPSCNARTVGPHSSENKSIDVGEAAHIRGAKPGSKRYEPDMTPAERSVITNGIWLCRTCAKLIDSDEGKYTVEILYKWKSQHEKEMDLQNDGSRSEILVKEEKLRTFEGETGAAQQLAFDKPQYWEVLLTVELLRSKLGPIKRQYSDLQRGLIFQQTRVLDFQQYLNWISAKMNDLARLVELLSVAASEEIMNSWGGQGVAGDPLEIKRATDIVASGCQALLTWEIDVRFTRGPDEIEPLRQLFKGWTEQYFAEIDKLSELLTNILNSPKSASVHNIEMTFRAPDNIDDVNKLMDELRLKVQRQRR